MSTARARMRRGTRQTAAERKSDEEFDVQKGSPGAQKQPPFLVPKEAARPSAKASRNSTNITNATKRKSDEEFDVQKRSPKILKNRPKPSAKATRNSTCQTSPLVTLFMSVLRLSLGNPGLWWADASPACLEITSQGVQQAVAADLHTVNAKREPPNFVEMLVQLHTVAVSLHGHQVGALLSGLAGMGLRGQDGGC